MPGEPPRPLPPPPAALDAESFADVLRRKWLGNELFKEGDLDGAVAHWDKALKLYGAKPGDGTQAGVQATLNSNKAEVFLKRQRYADAKLCCDRALELDDANFKARFRRARACIAIGGFEELSLAADDVKRIQADGGTLGEAEAALLRTAQGSPLLPSVGGAASKPSNGKGTTTGCSAISQALRGAATSSLSEEEVAAADADARERAAAAVAALGPEMAAALANAGATGTPEQSDSSAEANSPAAAEPPPAADEALDRTDWMELLDDRPSLRAAWLVDVYRTSFNAESTGDRKPEVARHCEGGPHASRLSILSDFCLFAKLAVARGVVPAHDVPHGRGLKRDVAAEWQWEALLGAAGHMLDKGFHPERCGAKHRYGDEAGDGDVMRRQAAIVYEAGRPKGDGLAPRMRDAIKLACWGEDEYDEEGNVLHRFSFDREPELFDDVGGVELWKDLNAQLKKGRLGGHRAR